MTDPAGSMPIPVEHHDAVVPTGIGYGCMCRTKWRVGVRLAPEPAMSTIG
jgi:hypothetical protein